MHGSNLNHVYSVDLRYVQATLQAQANKRLWKKKKRQGSCITYISSSGSPCQHRRQYWEFVRCVLVLSAEVNMRSPSPHVCYSALHNNGNNICTRLAALNLIILPDVAQKSASLGGDNRTRGRYITLSSWN